MPNGKDGAILVEIRNGCLKELYERYLFEGFHGRCNGSRAVDNPSPVPGSNIVLGNQYEVVVIYQIDNGRGPIAVIAYKSDPNGPSALAETVRSILVGHGYL